MTKRIEMSIPALGVPRRIEPRNGTDYSLKECQEMVGGYIEIVRLGEGWILVVNEDGIRLDLPANAYASALTGQLILGDVALMRTESLK